MYHRLFHTAVIVLSIIFGQTPGLHARANAGGTLARVELRFIFLDDQPATYTLQVEGNRGERVDTRTMTVEPYTISPPLAVLAGQKIRVARSDAGTAEQPAAQGQNGKDSDGRNEASVIGDFNAPDASRLIVMHPAARNEAGHWRSLSFPDDTESFPKGSIRVINLSDAPAVGAFGNEGVQLAPGEARIIHPRLDARQRTRTRIGVLKNADSADGRKIIYNSITSIANGQRVTGVLVYSPSGLSFTYTDTQLEELDPLPADYFWLTSTDRIE